MVETKFRDIRKSCLKKWLKETGRTFKTTDNIAGAFECTWQDRAFDDGFNHISIFCSIGEFAAHITDQLRDYRYDKYKFNCSPEVNEVLFRYYSRLLLVVSEILTDMQDLWILAEYQLSTKEYNGLENKLKREYQDTAREKLSVNKNDLVNLFDFINKICKHKTPNFHLCNNHIEYHFEDFEPAGKIKQAIEIGNVRQFFHYDKSTFKKHLKPRKLVVPRLDYIIDVLIHSYVTISNQLFEDEGKYKHVCTHFDDK